MLHQGTDNGNYRLIHDEFWQIAPCLTGKIFDRMILLLLGKTKQVTTTAHNTLPS
jgi:hypothetical protein